MVNSTGSTVEDLGLNPEAATCDVTLSKLNSMCLSLLFNGNKHGNHIAGLLREFNDIHLDQELG